MNSCLRKDQFIELMKARTIKDIEKILSKLKIADSKLKPTEEYDFKWKEIGDSLSNAANIETTSSSIACIIERITNAFDANIELQRIRDKTSKDLPPSPRHAVEKLFKIPGGDMGKYGNESSQEERARLSSLTKVEFYDSGDEQRPTIIIKDVGIGQHPSDFKSTFLKLGSSNKISSPHLHGTYGHGGSSTYRFCDYSVIISRMPKEVLNGKEDLIGWTIIRKDNSMAVYSEKDKEVVQIKKPPIYQYLCLISGEVPFMIPDDDVFDISHGSWVTHIEYSAREWHNLSRGLGFRLFRNYLFDPVMPFRLEDLRSNRESFNRNMFGSRSTLMGSSDVAYSNEATEYLEDGGVLKIRYWVLFDNSDPTKRPLTNYLERENSRDTIILTLNGQRHAVLEKSIIAKELRLSNLSQCLLVQIEVDGLSRLMKSRLFTSNRENTVDDENEIDLIKTKLKECLEEDEELKEWERRILVQISKITDDKSSKSVKNILDRLIQIGIMPGFGGSHDVSIEGGTGSSTEYKPQDPVTSLRFITTQDPIEVIEDKPKTINLEINGPNDLFTRRKNRATLIVDIMKDIGLSVHFNVRDLKNGRLPISLIPGRSIETYNPKKLKITLTADNIKSLLETEKQVVIVDPPKFNPVDPPSEFKFLRISPAKLIAGKPNTIGLSMNGNDDIFERSKSQASFDFKSTSPLAKLVRIRRPNRGKMQISIFVDETAKIGETFFIECEIKMEKGISLKDKIECVIIKPEDKDKEHGAKTTVSLPNYEVKAVYKEEWSFHNWDETSAGKYDITRDEDDKDKLILYVNADNENIVYEINRRIGKGQHATANSIRERYIAYMAYHLYLTYDFENNGETPENETESAEKPVEITDEQKQDEYRRVSKTLALSFQAMNVIPEEQISFLKQEFCQFW